MNILGISAYYHDSSAALVKNGRILAAVEEEKFTRVKHDNCFPFKAIAWCLASNNLAINDVDVIAYYEKPLLKFERILETFVRTWPYAIYPFVRNFPEQLRDKITIENTLRKKLKYKGKIVYIPHHHSHAAAAFYTSPFSQAAVLTIDGVGEYQTTGLWQGTSQGIKQLESINFPDSLGLLYSTFTAFLGFKVNEDEYKLMGLAAYGKPAYANKIKRIIDIKSDGSFRLDMRYFRFREEFRMWSRQFETLFGRPRQPHEKILGRHADLAASIQAVTEEIYFKILNHLHRLTGSDNLCLSGGVSLNALANGKIYQKTPFKKVYVVGAAGDNGAALGAALFASGKPSPLNTIYLGPSYSDKDILSAAKKTSLKCHRLDDAELIDTAAGLLAEGKIIGWFQDRLEFGPRALGNRSILAKASPKNMKEKVNIIKIREQFRPFAGSILQEHVHEYFDVPEKNHWSPFMTFCFQVKKDKRKEIDAIVHKDKSCRIQSVNKDNGRYYDLIKKFHGLTGTACILNTSFNLKGEPIVENPEQAIADFQKTEIDYLFINNYFLSKS